MAFQVLQSKVSYPATTITPASGVRVGSLVLISVSGYWSGSVGTLTVTAPGWNITVAAQKGSVSLSSGALFWATSKGGLPTFTLNAVGAFNDAGMHFWEVDLPAPHRALGGIALTNAANGNAGGGKPLPVRVPSLGGCQSITFAHFADESEASATVTYAVRPNAVLTASGQFSQSAVWLTPVPSGSTATMTSLTPATNNDYAFFAVTVETAPGVPTLRKLAGAQSSLSPITGTSATTNANDTSTAAGSPISSGTSATTNANDAGAAAGSPIDKGTSATTNANDTSTASGSVGSVTGTSATTNADDTCAAYGSSGSLPVIDYHDGGDKKHRKRKEREEERARLIADAIDPQVIARPVPVGAQDVAPTQAAAQVSVAPTIDVRPLKAAIAGIQAELDEDEDDVLMLLLA